MCEVLLSISGADHIHSLCKMHFGSCAISHDYQSKTYENVKYCVRSEQNTTDWKYRRNCKIFNCKAKWIQFTITRHAQSWRKATVQCYLKWVLHGITESISQVNKRVIFQEKMSKFTLEREHNQRPPCKCTGMKPVAMHMLWIWAHVIWIFALSVTIM